MNTAMKIFLSMSCSGTLLILALLAGKQVWKDKFSRQWQYYIWLIVILRLLLPFGPETSLMGWACQAVEETVSVSLPEQKELPISAASSGQDEENAGELAENLTASLQLRDIVTLSIDYLWLAAALGMLVRKITIYQSFVRYVKSGSVPVSDLEILDRLSIAAEQAGVKRPVELWVNPLVASPLLIGFLRPCVVLPGADISEKDFHYIVLHEMTHYRRGDMFYKWLVQVTLCLHWFNPFVYLMSREITKACEFSCDEAVLKNAGYDSAQEYGKTLLDAMAAVGTYRESLGAVTLNENKQLLKERLSAIMNFKKKSKATRFLTGMLTLCIVLGAAASGVYSSAAAYASPVDAEKSTTSDSKEKTSSSSASAQAEKYYEAGSLPLFEIAFSRLDMDEQSAWLDRIYEDGQIAFFSVSVNQLALDSPLIGRFAEKVYQARSISFFSVLMNRMSRDKLEDWLDRALEDGLFAFQSVLFNRLDMDDELDALEEELAQKQMEEYKAAGVTMDDTNYYYKGQTVHIFLDQHGAVSYTFGVAPEGTVNIRIVRGDDGKISGVASMTEEEVTKLLESFGASEDDCKWDDDWNWDWDDDDDWDWDWDEKALMAAYAAQGITKNGKSYYYQGNLVGVFLDQRTDSGFYTLEINPKGTKHIKIIRSKSGEITGVAYMTADEAAEFLEE